MLEKYHLTVCTGIYIVNSILYQTDNINPQANKNDAQFTIFSTRVTRMLRTLREPTKMPCTKPPKWARFAMYISSITAV